MDWTKGKRNRQRVTQMAWVKEWLRRLMVVTISGNRRVSQARTPLKHWNKEKESTYRWAMKKKEKKDGHRGTSGDPRRSAELNGRHTR